MQSALAAEYAHATAPLRRLVDRYVGETCVALCAGAPVPAWVLKKLDVLPDTMRAADHQAGQFEHATIDLLEAVVLAPRVGESFPAIVTSIDGRDAHEGTVMIDEPAIETRIRDGRVLPLGERVTVKLTEAAPAQRRIRFELA